MAAKNPKAGRGKCPTCGHAVVFRRSTSTGKLTYTCDECDSNGFADKGGKAEAQWSASIAPAAAEEEAPPVEVKPAKRITSPVRQSHAEEGAAAPAAPAAPPKVATRLAPGFSFDKL